MAGKKQPLCWGAMLPYFMDNKTLVELDRAFGGLNQHLNTELWQRSMRDTVSLPQPPLIVTTRNRKRRITHFELTPLVDHKEDSKSNGKENLVTASTVKDSERGEASQPECSLENVADELMSICRSICKRTEDGSSKKPDLPLDELSKHLMAYMAHSFFRVDLDVSLRVAQTLACLSEPILFDLVRLMKPTSAPCISLLLLERIGHLNSTCSRILLSCLCQLPAESLVNGLWVPVIKQHLITSFHVDLFSRWCKSGEIECGNSRTYPANQLLFVLERFTFASTCIKDGTLLAPGDGLVQLFQSLFDRIKERNELNLEAFSLFLRSFQSWFLVQTGVATSRSTLLGGSKKFTLFFCALLTCGGQLMLSQEHVEVCLWILDQMHGTFLRSKMNSLVTVIQARINR